MEGGFNTALTEMEFKENLFWCKNLEIRGYEAAFTKSVENLYYGKPHEFQISFLICKKIYLLILYSVSFWK